MKGTGISFSPRPDSHLISNLLGLAQRFPHSAQFGFVVFLCATVPVRMHVRVRSASV